MADKFTKVICRTRKKKRPSLKEKQKGKVKEGKGLLAKLFLISTQVVKRSIIVLCSYVDGDRIPRDHPVRKPQSELTDPKNIYD